MKTWKRNAIIAGVLVLVCAGIYLNWLYGRDSTDLTKSSMRTRCWENPPSC